MQKTSASFPGILYVVATPIGNLDDITFRAINTLKSVDAILAEDTRHSAQLCHALGIQKPLMSLHAHNESEKGEQIIAALLQGQSFALISDAGTPLISDPGFILVKRAQEENIRVVPIPGACALITALCAAGIPCDSFTFIGFLPAKSTARREKLNALKNNSHTVIFYESTHRIIECLNDFSDVYGAESNLVLAKELTKNFEHFIHASAEKIKEWLLAESGRTKGEFVLIIPPAIEKKSATFDDRILQILLKELPLKQAVKLTAQITDQPRNELYKYAVQSRGDVQE